MTDAISPAATSQRSAHQVQPLSDTSALRQAAFMMILQQLFSSSQTANFGFGQPFGGEPGPLGLLGTSPSRLATMALGQAMKSAKAAVSLPRAMPRTSGDALPFQDLIQATAARHRLSPALLTAVIKAESGFNPQAVSRAGAKGLMQLMDGTARSLGVRNAFDPAENIDGGARFLSNLLRRYGGDVALALAAYNAGPGSVEHYGGIPPYAETQTYVHRVLGLMNEFTA